MHGFVCTHVDKRKRHKQPNGYKSLSVLYASIDLPLHTSLFDTLELVEHVFCAWLSIVSVQGDVGEAP
jgi:hypothetical protein